MTTWTEDLGRNCLQVEQRAVRQCRPQPGLQRNSSLQYVNQTQPFAQALQKLQALWTHSHSKIRKIFWIIPSVSPHCAHAGHQCHISLCWAAPSVSCPPSAIPVKAQEIVWCPGLGNFSLDESWKRSFRYLRQVSCGHILVLSEKQYCQELWNVSDMK